MGFVQTRQGMQGLIDQVDEEQDDDDNPRHDKMNEARFKAAQ